MTNKMTILVVDDHPTSRLKLSMVVKTLGHEVATADDGRHALDVMRADPPDLVLLDLLMPELDGYGVLEAMREDAALRTIPVIAISSVDEEESVRRAVDLGAKAFIAKEFGAAELNEQIEKLAAEGKFPVA